MAVKVTVVPTHKLDEPEVPLASAVRVGRAISVTVQLLSDGEVPPATEVILATTWISSVDELVIGIADIS